MATTQTTKRKGKLHHSNTRFDEVYGIPYFMSEFKNKYPKYMLGEKGSKEKKVSESLYKQILVEYFDIYFKEIYFINRPSYFLYTGIMDKVLYRPRIIKKNQVNIIAQATIGFMWSMRPSNLFFYCVRFIKLTGKLNKIPKIEKLYKNNFDIHLIPNFEDAIKHCNENNLNYLK
jgi:hypothetical protein